MSQLSTNFARSSVSSVSEVRKHPVRHTKKTTLRCASLLGDAHQPRSVLSQSGSLNVGPGPQQPWLGRTGIGSFGARVGANPALQPPSAPGALAARRRPAPLSLSLGAAVLR